MITQERLKEILNYNPENGIITWRVSVAQRIKVGDIAGAVQLNNRLYIMIKGKSYLAHRLAWLYTYGEFPKDMLDHIDGNPLNNSIKNLRECSSSENQKNQGISKHNTSGFKGVTWNKRVGKWQAQASIKGRKRHLGYFSIPEEASVAYNDFAKAQHGEFYRDTTGASQ